MIVLRIDSILKAVSIERGDKQAIYCPKPASMRRLLRLTCQAWWVYRPCFQPQVHVWELSHWREQGTVQPCQE